MPFTSLSVLCESSEIRSIKLEICAHANAEVKIIEKCPHTYQINVNEML